MIKVGDKLVVWWKTGEVEDGQNIATVLEVKPYTGRYTEYYDCILKLTSSETKCGYLERAYKN